MCAEPTGLCDQAISFAAQQKPRTNAATAAGRILCVGCEQLILGSGQMGNVHLSPEAEAYFREEGLQGAAAHLRGDRCVQH